MATRIDANGDDEHPGGFSLHRLSAAFEAASSRKTGHIESSDKELTEPEPFAHDDAPHASSFSGQFGLLAAEDPDLPVPDPDHPRAGVRVRRRRRLQRIASCQEGLFTIGQAASAGLDRRARYHHLHYGNWRYTDTPGVYRLVSWPPDPLERMRSWSLAIDLAPLTSWSALEALDLTVAGPRQPVHLAVADRRRRKKLVRTVCADLASVRLHEAHSPLVESLNVHGLTVRPASEALCVVVMGERARPSSCAQTLALTEQLIDLGKVDLQELMSVAASIGAGTVLDAFWTRYERELRRRSA